MGEIEQRNKIRVRNTRINRAILESVKAAGILSVALLAPNAIKVLDEFGLMPKERRKEYIPSSGVRLVKKGLLEFRNGHYELTKAGERILKLWNISNHGLRRPKKWDKKWRMIIFDIPEKKKKIRKRVSEIFTRANLYRLQDSVWVYPFDCEDVIGLLKTELGIGKEVLYVIADEIENDKHLRGYYELLS